MISILNYGMGNVGSIANMLKKVGASARTVSTPEEILSSQALIIPGVGHIDNAITNLNSLNLIEPLNEMALKRQIPVLGICLGMQIMTKKSEEGTKCGFGWIDAETKRFDSTNTRLRVPHMGWNIAIITKNHPAFSDTEINEYRFYFVHSYAVHCNNPKDILTTTEYGINFTSAYSHDNITGVQFHPEKSHKYGESFFRSYYRDFINK